MIPQDRQPDTDEQIIAYLLGELPDDEMARLEDRYFAKDDLFAQMQAVEAELHDAYARGELSADRNIRFERRLLTTSAQRRRGAFSRAFVQMPREQSWFGRRRPRLILAVAGVAAALFVTVVIGLRGTHPRANQTSDRKSLSPAEVVAPFTLVSGMSRDGGSEATFEIPKGTTLVRFRAELARKSHRSYESILRTPEGAEVWRASGLQAQPAGSLYSVVLEIPASLLASGHYAITLSGETRASGREDLADYSFRLIRQAAPR